MQDNEFDDFFRSKLEDFEVEPAEHLWQGIDSSLKADRRRAILMPALRIAAILLIALAAGWIFIDRQPEQIIGKKPRLALVVKKQNSPSKPTVTIQEPLQTPVVKTMPHAPVTKTLIAKLRGRPAHENEPLTNKQRGDPNAMQVTIADLSPASVTRQHVVPEKDVQLNIDLPDKPIKTTAADNSEVLAQAPGNNNEEQANTATNSSNKRVNKRGLTGLVSLVSDRFNKSRAAMVDNDDDDESVIGEVSKGIKKIKKDREIKGGK